MRRPPDKDGKIVTDRDVDSSNATLRTLAGGVRQKSWMLGAPVRPTPRANVSRISAPQITLPQKTTTILTSPTPSDGSSPPLPDTHVNGAQAEGLQSADDSPQILSTTITRSAPILRSPVTENESRPTQNVSSIDDLNQASPAASPAQAQAISSSANSTPQTSSIPPLPSSVLLPADRELGEPSSTTIQDSHTTQARSAALPTRTVSRGQLSPGVQAQVRDFQSRNNQQSTLASPIQANDSSGSNMPAVTNQQDTISANLPSGVRTHPVPGPALSSPRKRQRLGPAAMPPLKPKVTLIDQHIQKGGGHDFLNAGLDRPRFQLLTTACIKEDAFYVALHQVFCCWDIDRNIVLNIVGYPSQNDLQTAFKILGQLIRDNDGLAGANRNFFAGFPTPLPDLMRNSEPYRRTVGEVGIFLKKLASEWNKLAHDCTTRGYPPLVDELVSRLGLLSPILQGVVFTASRRNLGIKDEEVGTQMEDLFSRDRAEHEALAARYNTNRPPTAREAVDRNRVLAETYLKLHSYLRRQRQSAQSPSGSHVTTPTLPSNDYTQSRAPNQPPVSQPQHQHVTQSDWAQSVNSTSSSVPQRPPNSMPHRLQRVPDVAPNPSVAVSRPPSAGSQHIYVNAPSSTHFQGLSMQSPVQQNFPSPTTRNDNQVAQQASNGVYYQNPSFQQATPVAQQSSRVAAHNQQIYHQQQIAAQYAAQQNQQRWLQHNSSQQQQQIQNQHQQIQHQQQQQQLQIQMQQRYQQQEMHRQQAQNIMAQQFQPMQAAARAVFNQNQNQPPQPRRASNPLQEQQTQHRRSISRNDSVTNNGHRPQNTSVSAGPRELSPAERTEIHKYNSKHVLHRSLIPPTGFTHPPQVQNPDVTALHHAHIRSPRLVAIDGLPSMSQDDPSSRYYQSIRGFILSPTRISPTSPLSRFDFTVPQHDLDLVAKDIHHASGQLPIREFKPGTLQYRLRCIQTKKTETRYTMPDWVVADTVWPDSAALSLNKTHLEIRRKNHHGKDLPIDITAFIRLSAPNATNQVSLSILKGRSKMKEFNYFIAVEVVEILSHSQVLEMAFNSHISASVTLNKIKKSLTLSSDDDDVAMVVSDLSIDLADPFTSKVFQTPVKGSSCLHRECFDLEVFLLTRNSKPKRPEQPCMVDVWKCPLCGKDARPYSLQIDDFLVSIRKELETQGKLDDVRAIFIDASGKWRPKIEPRNSNGREDSDYSSDGDGAFNRAPSASKQNATKKVVEIISLDD